MMKAKTGEKGDRQTHTYSTYTPTVTHGCTLTLDPLLLSVSSPTIIFTFDMATLCVCVHSDHGRVRSDRFYNLIPAVKTLYTHTQCKKSELRRDDVDVFFPWIERRTQRGREGEARGR